MPHRTADAPCHHQRREAEAYAAPSVVGEIPTFPREVTGMPCFETSDHTTLFYIDWGTGDPVVFVHGQGLGADMGEYQALDVTDQGVHCIAYDQRGYGRSDQPGHGYDFDTFAAVASTAARTARAIPGGQFVVYEGASHGLFFTHRDRLNGDLLAFIRG
jgi:pimeloyl-ACP methyl ester carboxylesterase